MPFFHPNIPVAPTLDLTPPNLHAEQPSFPSSVWLSNSSNAQPSLQDAVEFTPQFRASAKRAIEMARLEEARRRHGVNAGGEAGFAVNQAGAPGPVAFSTDGNEAHGSMQQTIFPSDLGALHTHDAFHQADPSGMDRQAAQKAHTTLWIASHDGLYGVDPAGQVTHLFSSPNWFDKNQNPYLQK